MEFTFVGIIYCHALKVLDKKNVKGIPTHYVLKRWTQDAKVGSIKNYHGIDVVMLKSQWKSVSLI